MTEIALSAVRAKTASVPLQADRIALLASYGSGPTVTRSLAALTAALSSRGYQTILIRASADQRPLEWPGTVPDGVSVVRRANAAYDFGSWSDVLLSMPDITSRDKVLFVNDSLIGPFSSIDPLLDDFETAEADAWGAITNPQVFPHVQSFLYGFRGQTLATPPLREFWAKIRPQVEKMDYVWKYELGLNRVLFSEGFVVESRFGDRSFGYGHVNPTLDRWKELMIRGFPFVKRALLTDEDHPERASEAVAFANDYYGIDIHEWL